MAPDLIPALAQEESLKLGEEHWVTRHIIRDYYAEPAITQNLRHAAWQIAEQIGRDKDCDKAQIFEPFPMK